MGASVLLVPILILTPGGGGLKPQSRSSMQLSRPHVNLRVYANTMPGEKIVCADAKGTAEKTQKDEIVTGAPVLSAASTFLAYPDLAGLKSAQLESMYQVMAEQRAVTDAEERSLALLRRTVLILGPLPAPEQSSRSMLLKHYKRFFAGLV